MKKINNNKRILKKIFTFCFIILLSIFIIGCTSPEKQEYYNNITALEQEINKLEFELDALKNTNEYLNSEINRLNKLYEEEFTKEEMYNWAHICNRDGMRSNMKVYVEHKKTFLGIPIDTKLYEVSGVLVKISSNKGYILTSNVVVQTIDGYNKKVCKVTDAFNVEYDATIIGYSTKYHLGLIEFTLSHDLLYAVKVASSSPKTNDPICNIFYNSNGPRNYMHYTKVSSYVKENGVDFNLLKNDSINSDTIYGGMALDINGNLAGVIIYTYNDNSNSVSSVPSEYIRKYLNENGINV